MPSPLLAPFTRPAMSTNSTVAGTCGGKVWTKGVKGRGQGTQLMTALLPTSSVTQCCPHATMPTLTGRQKERKKETERGGKKERKNGTKEGNTQRSWIKQASPLSVAIGEWLQTIKRRRARSRRLGDPRIDQCWLTTAWLSCAFHPATHQLLGLGDVGQHLQAGVGNGHHASVGLDRAEGEVGSLEGKGGVGQG